VIVMTFLVGRAVVTTPDTARISPAVGRLPDRTDPERTLPLPAAMDSATSRLRRRVRSAQGFSIVELLIVITLIGIVSAIAIGVTPDIVRVAKGQSGAQQLSAFLKRHREMAVSRRRNIEITFTAPNVVSSLQRAVPDPPNPTPAPTPLETIYLEGDVDFRLFPGVPDTPDAFGNAAPINLGGANPVMFTSEGSFTDVNGDPINASLFMGIENQPNTANALTIIGTTAAVRSWRWNAGAAGRWVQ
jgi:prepilin-type N-terminal cleavage/methylation domain-containing protein